MDYKHISYPENGDKIRSVDNQLVVSDNPILGYVEGDGIGADITTACLRVWVPTPWASIEESSVKRGW